MLFDLLKIIAIIVILIFVWLFLQSTFTGNPFGNRALQITDIELWQTESPMRGTITISANSRPTASNPVDEYITLDASPANTEAIDMTGWSLQSVVSDTRIYIPPATLMLRMISGNNNLQPVHLAPGEYAIIHTGKSPLSGIAQSFHTNSCIGYLSQFNSFEPKLKSACTDPSTILPSTPDNIRTYGSACVNFLNNAPSCTTYTTEMPAHLLPACRDLIARKLTYHSCLSEAYEKNGHDIFNNGGWYLYLDHSAEVWRNNYEAIRLLDSGGLVVDVLRY